MITALSQEHNFRLVTESGASYTVRESHFDLVLQMTNTGARTVTLPTAPPHLQRITIRDAAGTAFSANITITAGAIPTDIAVINVNDDAVTLIYDQPSNKWLNDKPSLDDRYELTTEATNTYTAVATQIPTTVLMSFNGARTVNLPAAPINGQRVVIVDQANVASDSTKRITITPAGGKTCDVASVDLNGDVASLIYIASQNNWKTTSQVEARFYEVVEATATYNVAASLHTTYLYMSNTGARTVNLPASPVSGQRVVIKDQASTAATANITITPAGGKTCEIANIATNGGAADLMYNASLNSWRSLVSLPITYSAENLVDLTVSTGYSVFTNDIVQIVSGAGVQKLKQSSGTSSAVSASNPDSRNRGLNINNNMAILTDTKAVYSYVKYDNNLTQFLIVTFNGTNTPTISSPVGSGDDSEYNTLSIASVDASNCIFCESGPSDSDIQVRHMSIDSNYQISIQGTLNISTSDNRYGRVCKLPGNTTYAMFAYDDQANPRTVYLARVNGTTYTPSASTTTVATDAWGPLRLCSVSSNTGFISYINYSTSNGRISFYDISSGSPVVSSYVSISGNTTQQICKSTTNSCFVADRSIGVVRVAIANGTNSPTLTSASQVNGTNSFSQLSIVNLGEGTAFLMAEIGTYPSAVTNRGYIVEEDGTNAPRITASSNSYPSTTNACSFNSVYRGDSGRVLVSTTLDDVSYGPTSFYSLPVVSTATGTTIGIARSSATGGNPASVSVGPIVTGLSGLTVGAKYYAQDGSGLLGTTTTSIYVGVALTTTKLLLQL